MTMSSATEQLFEDVAVVCFDAIMGPVAETIGAHAHELRKLVEIDYLLPKLLSGAVRVSAEAELKLGAM